MKIKLIPFLAIFFILGCESNTDRLSLERDVYQALFSYMGGDDAKVLTIRENSTIGRDFLVEEKNKYKLELEAYKAFVAINKKGSRLPIDSEWDHRVTLLSKEEIEGIFNKSALKLNWKSFYKKYPESKGLIGLSRVGFNKGLDEAFLYIEMGCGPLCGSGYHAWMSKGLFGWKVDILEDLWVS